VTTIELREPAVATRPGAPGRANVIRLVPWLFPVVAGVGGLLAIDVPSQLRSQYGVRWIYADLRDGPVSVKLNDLAVLRHQDSRVKIYELARR
jgi:hypothetical protein